MLDRRRPTLTPSTAWPALPTRAAPLRRRIDALALAVAALVAAVAALDVSSALGDPAVPTVTYTIGGGPAVFDMVPDRALRKLDRYHWYELTDAQDAALRAALKSYRPARPIMVLTGTPDALSLAEDFDAAFQDAGLKSEIYQATDVVAGLHCTDAALAALVVAATRIPVVVDRDDTAPPGYIVLNFGRKVGAEKVQ